MKVAITGSRGFIGSHLKTRLEKDGHEVMSFDNYSTGFRENQLDGCRYADIDINAICHFSMTYSSLSRNKKTTIQN